MMAERRAEYRGPAMRVLHVNHSDEFGGAELSLYRMLDADPPWDPVLLLPRRGTAHESVFAGLGGSRTKVLRAGAPSAVGASAAKGISALLVFAKAIVSEALALRRSVARECPDFVWANSSRSAVYCALGLLFDRTALIVHLRDRVDRESLGKVGFALMSRFVLPRAAGVVANSRSTLDSARRYTGRLSRNIVIPSAAGIPAQRAKRDFPIQADDQGSKVLRVAMVARIDPWKGQALLVEAFNVLKQSTSRPVRLHLAGAPEFGNDLYLRHLKEQIGRLSLNDDIVFEGRISQVQSFLSQMDICIQYSTRPEPLGQNVLQYLASGAAVVAAAEGGPIEWIVNDVNGVLVPPRSVEALSKALIGLVEDDARRLRLSSAASQTPGLLTDSEVGTAAHRYLMSLKSDRKERAS